MGVLQPIMTYTPPHMLMTYTPPHMLMTRPSPTPPQHPQYTQPPPPQHPQYTQVLAPTKVGEGGTWRLNKQLQELLNPAQELGQPPKRKIPRRFAAKSGGPSMLRVGDRVMQTQNNNKLEVYNGDIGYVGAWVLGLVGWWVITYHHHQQKQQNISLIAPPPPHHHHHSHRHRHHHSHQYLQLTGM